MEMEVGDDNTVGPSRLEYYQHQTASYTANVTHATHASPVHKTHMHSLHTGRREAKMRIRIPSLLYNVAIVLR